MDRLARILRSRLVVPLVGLVLVSLAWLALRHNAPAPEVATSSQINFEPYVPTDAAAPPLRLAVMVGGDAPGAKSGLTTTRVVALKSEPTEEGPALFAPGLQSGQRSLTVTVDPSPSEADAASPVAPSPESIGATKGSKGDSPVFVERKLGQSPERKPGQSATAEKSKSFPAQQIEPEFTTSSEAVAKQNQAAAPKAASEELPQKISQQPGMLMLPDNAPPSRSEQLESIARQADAHIYHGFELANRNASFAARSEFIAALRLIAQGLDTENRTTIHSRALSAGLTAIKEADDFVPTGTKLEAELDLAVIIGSHRTPVLKNASADDLRPMTAVKCYFTFAQEQMAAAAGHEVAGSMALRALGKLHATLARQKSLEVKLSEPKAMVYFQSALLVFPQNYMASNDLGVLLAQCGNYSEARRTLEHSVSIYRGAENLNNLATVYRQLGQTGLAATTQQQADLARNLQTARLKNMQASADGSVRWVSPPALAQTSESTTIATQPRQAQATTVKPNPSTSTAQPTVSANPKQPSGEKPAAGSNSSAVGWLPSIFGQPKAR